MMTFDPELKIWDAASEADLVGWKLWFVEMLPVDRHYRAYIVTARRDQENRDVYVNRELGQSLHAKFVKALEEYYIQFVTRHSKRESNER